VSLASVLFSKKMTVLGDYYNNLYSKFDWNHHDVPIIPAVHGTGEQKAWNICSTGFAALSSNDKGWYGKGIYFTSSCLYASPYYAMQKGAALLICFVIPGNIKPVTEHPEGKHSYIGCMIDTGYQSHYVLTDKKGYPADLNILHSQLNINQLNNNVYDEIVIANESQAVPVFLVIVSMDFAQKVLQVFQRITPEQY